ncbi:hypothetical protein KY320_03630 [Candidatus Woesearchaeota archaeon]|nr:hypothetical protein [Candidatus Woesearchaeota archaeon]
MKGFMDVTQTEQWFTQLFGLSIKAPLVGETKRQFLLKAPLLMLGVVLFGFLLLEKFPSLIAVILMLIFFYLTVFLLLKFMDAINSTTEVRSILGIALWFLPLIVLVLLL